VYLYILLWRPVCPIHPIHELSYNTVCCFYLLVLSIKGRFVLCLCCLLLGASFLCWSSLLVFSHWDVLGISWLYISAACCLLLCIYLCFGISLFLHVFPAHLDIVVVYKVFCGLKPVHWSGDRTNQNETRFFRFVSWKSYVTGTGWVSLVYKCVTTCQTSARSRRDAIGGDKGRGDLAWLLSAREEGEEIRVCLQSYRWWPERIRNLLFLLTLCLLESEIFKYRSNRVERWVRDWALGVAAARRSSGYGQWRDGVGAVGQQSPHCNLRQVSTAARCSPGPRAKNIDNMYTRLIVSWPGLLKQSKWEQYYVMIWCSFGG